MRIKVKICGITRYEDAKVAVNLGVDALGFIFFKKSARNIEPSDARAIVSKLPPFVTKVGVFVNESLSHINEISQHVGLTAIQLHGDEDTQFCNKPTLPVIKAFSVKPDSDLLVIQNYSVSAVLLDTWNEKMYGGTGTTFDWSVAKRICKKYDNVILAGGLGPANLSEALETVGPYGVDLNSGVEIMPGIKNPVKMRDAVKIVHNWKKIC